MARTLQRPLRDAEEAICLIADALRAQAHDDEDWLDMLCHVNRVLPSKELERLLVAEAEERGLCPVCFVEGRGVVPTTDDGNCATCKAAVQSYLVQLERCRRTEAEGVA